MAITAATQAAQAKCLCCRQKRGAEQGPETCCSTQFPKTVLPILAEASIANMAVDFDSNGNSEGIENVQAEADGSEIALPDGSITLLTLGWREAEPAEKTMLLSEAIEQMVYELLEIPMASLFFNVVTKTTIFKFNMQFKDSKGVSFFIHAVAFDTRTTTLKSNMRFKDSKSVLFLIHVVAFDVICTIISGGQRKTLE